MRHTERRIRPLILDILFCKGEQVHVCGHRDQLPLAPGGGGGGTTRPPLPHLHSTCTLLTPGTYLSLILCSPRYVYVPLIQCSLQVPLHVTMLTYVRYLNLLILLAQEPDLTQYYPVLYIAHLSFLVLSCYILFFLSSAQCSSVPFSCPILSFRVFSCPILSYPVRSCLLVSYPVLPSPFRSILS